jgi:hypothetical protein
MLTKVGNSLQKIGEGPGAPAKFIKCLQIWLRSAFGESFAQRGNVLSHAVQDDYHSCGIITINTLAHAALGKRLWETSQAVEERLNWFIRLATESKKHQGQSTAPIPESKTQDHRYVLSNLLNPKHDPAPLAYSASAMLDYDSDSSSSSHSSTESAIADTVDGADIPNPLSESEPVIMASSGQHAVNVPSAHKSISVMDENVDDNIDSPANLECLLDNRAKTLGRLAKRKRSEYDSVSDDGNSTDSCGSGRTTKYTKPGQGTSRSAIASRRLRQQLSNGTFQVDQKRLAAWKTKIEA